MTYPQRDDVIVPQHAIAVSEVFACCFVSYNCVGGLLAIVPQRASMQ